MLENESLDDHYVIKNRQGCILPLSSAQNSRQLHHKGRGNSKVRIAPYSKNVCASSWLGDGSSVEDVLITR
jgi:hypothetical protein